MLIQGEPERAPNTQETGSGVYFYLFVRDLTYQRRNAHAQTSRGRPLMVKVITNAVDQMVGIAVVQCGLISRMIKSALWSGYWVIFDHRHFFMSSWSHGSGNHSRLA